MKILHLTTHLDIGGITSYLLTVTAGLRARGHNVMVMSGDGAMRQAFEAAGVPQRVAPLRTKSELHPKLWLAYRQLVRLLRAQPAELLHAHTRVSQVVGAAASRRLGIPMVTTWHGFYRPHWGRRVWPCWGEQVIAISPPVQQHLLRAFGVPAARVSLIEHGISLERFRPAAPETTRLLRQEFGIAQDAFVVGVVARLVRDKGVDMALRAVARLVSRYPQVYVLVVGSGPEEARLRALAGTLQITNRALFFGSQADLTAPLGIMDSFVFPILGREGFGLVLLEAMAMEVPVIATTQPALVHVLDEGRAGLLVPPGDVETLARAIARLIAEPDFAKQLSLRGAGRVRDRFTSQRMLDELEQVYQHVLQRYTKPRLRLPAGRQGTP